VTAPLKPILVCMSWRGGERLARCLASIANNQSHFARIVLSITARHDSDDMRRARKFCVDNPLVELICTGKELPTMQHQSLWVDYLSNTGVGDEDWIYWLAYDDEVRLAGINRLVDSSGSWPLIQGTAYFGPWAMRHESADYLWDGDPSQQLESWTSFPIDGPTRLPVTTWVRQQIHQPTYIQMSGSVCTFSSFLDLRHSNPKKRGPMRIEMAIAASPCNDYVAEFVEPVTIIYGRPNSDRAAYGKGARVEDLHLFYRLGRYALQHPQSFGALGAVLTDTALSRIRVWSGNSPLPTEEWRVRSTVLP